MTGQEQFGVRGRGMMGTSLPQSSCYHHQGTILLSRFLISSNVPELFYELVPENTALDAYSLGADAGWESVGGGLALKRSYKILKEIRTGNVEFTMETNT